MRGWNHAYNGKSVPAHWHDDDARRGYYSYLGAKKDEQIPYHQDQLRAEAPQEERPLSHKDMLTHFGKKAESGNQTNPFRNNWYQRAFAYIRRAEQMENLLRQHKRIFQDYAALHRLKHTVEGNRKAVANAEEADLIDEVLNG
jgi:hypothetical protein